MMYSVWVGNLLCVMMDFDGVETVVMQFAGTFAVAVEGCIWGGRFCLAVPISSAQLPTEKNYKQYFLELSLFSLTEMRLKGPLCFSFYLRIPKGLQTITAILFPLGN